MQVLLRHFGCLLTCLALASGLSAQSVVAHRLDELRVPAEGVIGLYHGPRGGMYALVDHEGEVEIRVHDGERWQFSHRLTEDEHVLPSLSGELLLTDGKQVFTFEWRFRAPARRVVVGQLRSDYVITRATYLHDAVEADQPRHPEVILETDRGILVSERGRIHKVTSAPMRLIGVSALGAFVATADGKVFVIGDRRRVVATLPPGFNDIVPIATTPSGDLLFRNRETVYALQPSKVERYRLRQMNTIEPGSELTVVGNRLLQISQGRALSYAQIEEGAAWHPIHYGGADARNTSALAVGGRMSFYSIGSRAIVRTQTGVVSVECVPNVVTPIQLDAALTSAIGPAGSALIVGQPDAVKVYSTEARARVKPTQSWPTFDNYMRNSVPTCVASFDGRIVVGTSDGRVLALNPAGPPEQLTSVVGYGMEFSDLYVDGRALWATFNPSSGRNSGLVKITDAGSGLQLDSTGLDGSVACVRRARGGRLYAASRRGQTPLHYYYETHNLWMKLPGRIEMATNHQGFEIHEFAPVSDSLIYIATSRGLLQWDPADGYRTVPMPHDLLDADIRSIKSADGGLWFTVQGQGAYFLRDGNLHTVEGAYNWSSFDFQPRGLIALANGDILLLNAGRVIKLQSPAEDHMPLRPGIIFATHPGTLFAARAEPGLRQSLWQGDSLYVHYALPGFAPDNLIAAFTVDGVTVRPTRASAGLAVFAPMQPGDYDLSVRVISREKGYSASVHVLALRVMPYWWTTGFGIFAIIVMSSLLALALASGYTLRQRTLAKELEQLVADRTRDLQIAQEKAQKASAAKSMFLANMSHEIRTPLNAVLGLGNLLLESNLSEEQRNFATSIQRGGNALHGIVGDILDFAEIDNGSVKRREASTNVSELVYELIATYAEYAADKGLFFGYDVDLLPTCVTTDAQKLRSAISHLLGNAIKFTLSGQIHLEARHERKIGGAADQLRISITDTGIGIDRADFARIFDVFEQADNSNTRRFGGTGLGLAIVKTYVECLGGEVTLESVLGGGSTFSLHLPLRLASRYVAQPRLVASEDIFRVSVESAHPEFDEQLRRLFSDGDYALATASEARLGAADVLVHGFTTAEELSAFRQNVRYRKVVANRGIIAVVYAGQRPARMELRESEMLVPYPLNPQELIDLATELRARRRAAHVWRTKHSRPHGSVHSQTDGRPHPTDEPTYQAGDTKISARSPQVRQVGPLIDNPSADHPDGPSTTEQNPGGSVPNSANSTHSVDSPSSRAKPVFFDLAAEHPLKILVAEDNPMNKMLILTVLTKLGYKADWVETGLLAVERFAAEAYDLILMDIHMPDMDGLQATREIRKRYFERPITIYALTANASEEGRGECFAAGMDDFMTKPLQVPALITLLRKVEPLASRLLAEEAARTAVAEEVHQL